MFKKILLTCPAKLNIDPCDKFTIVGFEVVVLIQISSLLSEVNLNLIVVNTAPG